MNIVPRTVSHQHKSFINNPFTYLFTYFHSSWFVEARGIHEYDLKMSEIGTLVFIKRLS